MTTKQAFQFDKTAQSHTPRYAPVVPLEIARIMQQKEVLGDYHLLLAHDVLANPTGYKDVYADKGYTILMDNSLVELGYAMPIHEVIEACHIVGAQYAILPDVLNDYEQTIHMTEEALSSWYTISDAQKRDIMLLPVIQGINLQQCSDFAERFISRHDIAGMCVPRIIADTLGSRRDVIQRVTRICRVHLLGFSNNVYDDVACARMPGVVGIDSAVPVRAALKGLQTTWDADMDYGKRGNYWDDPFERYNLEIERLVAAQQIERNVNIFREWITRGLEP